MKRAGLISSRLVGEQIFLFRDPANLSLVTDHMFWPLFLKPRLLANIDMRVRSVKAKPEKASLTKIAVLHLSRLQFAHKPAG